MDIELVFKIAAIGIIVAVLNQLLIRSGREDQAMMTTLAGLVVVLSILVKQISTLFVTIKALLSLGAAVWLLLRLAQPLRGVLQAMVQLGQRTNAQAFSCLLRSAGILLLADYVRTLCEEAGADTLAWCAGLAGRCLVLAAVWPLLEQIFQTIWGLVG